MPFADLSVEVASEGAAQAIILVVRATAHRTAHSVEVDRCRPPLRNAHGCEGHYPRLHVLKLDTLPRVLPRAAVAASEAPRGGSRRQKRRRQRRAGRPMRPRAGAVRGRARRGSGGRGERGGAVRARTGRARRLCEWHWRPPTAAAACLARSDGCGCGCGGSRGGCCGCCCCCGGGARRAQCPWRGAACPCGGTAAARRRHSVPPTGAQRVRVSVGPRTLVGRPSIV